MLEKLRARVSGIVFAAPLSIAFVAMFTFFTIWGRGFLNADNLTNVALQSAALCIVAVAVGLVMIAGYIDLSVGSVLGLSGVTAGFLITQSHWNPAWAAMAGVGVGVVAGLVTGSLVALFRFSALIVTLGMLTILRGTTFAITDQTFYDFGAGFSQFGSGLVLGVPIPVWIAIAVCVASAVFLNFTPTGRHVYAIGVNQEAAYFSGVDIRKIPLLLFAISGAAAGLAGIITIARIDAAPSGSLGVGFELTALTAVLLGGVSFAGGRGTIFGIVLGVLFLGVLQNGLAIMNVSFANQQIANGVALVVATALERGSVWFSSRGGTRSSDRESADPGPDEVTRSVGNASATAENL